MRTPGLRACEQIAAERPTASLVWPSVADAAAGNAASAHTLPCRIDYSLIRGPTVARLKVSELTSDNPHALGGSVGDSAKSESLKKPKA